MTNDLLGDWVRAGQAAQAAVNALIPERQLRFWVGGEPAPQGSKTVYRGKRGGKPIVVESSKALAPWRDSVHYAATVAIADSGWQCLDAPAEVWLVWALRKPPSVPKKRIYPSVKPDGDKLERAVLDALTTAGVLADDARVVTMHWAKRYALASAETGCEITVAPA